MTTHATVWAVALLSGRASVKGLPAYVAACNPQYGLSQDDGVGCFDATDVYADTGNRSSCPKCLVLVDAALEGRFLVRLPEVA